MKGTSEVVASGEEVPLVEQLKPVTETQPSVRLTPQTSAIESSEKEDRLPAKDDAKESFATKSLTPGNRLSNVAEELVDNKDVEENLKQKAVKKLETGAVAVEVSVPGLAGEAREERTTSRTRKANKRNEQPKCVVSVESPVVEASTTKEKPTKRAKAASSTGAEEVLLVCDTVAEVGTDEIKASLRPDKESVRPTQEAKQGAETPPTETVQAYQQTKIKKVKTPYSTTTEEGIVSPMPSEIVVTADRLEKVVKTATKKIADSFPADGMTVSQATSLLTVPELKTLEKPSAQVALLTMAERVGVSHEVHQAVVQEVSSSREAVRTIGFTALLKALESNQATSTDIVANFLPEDFDQKKVKTTLADVLKEAYEVTTTGAEEKEQRGYAEPSLRAIRTLAEELSEGKEVGEIVASSALSLVKDMQCLETQMAIVSVLDRLGLGQVTEAVVLEQLGGERSGLLNTVGSRALASTMSQQAVTTEQVLACLQPEDLRRERVQECVANILSFAQTVNTTQVDSKTACYFTVGELANQASDG